MTTTTSAPVAAPVAAPTATPTDESTPSLDWLANVEPEPETERKEVDEEPKDADADDDEPDEIQVTIVTTEEYTVVADSPEHAIAKIFSPSGEGLDDENGVTLIGRCVQANGHDHPTYLDDTEDNTKEA